MDAREREAASPSDNLPGNITPDNITPDKDDLLTPPANNAEGSVEELPAPRPQTQRPRALGQPGIIQGPLDDAKGSQIETVPAPQGKLVPPKQDLLDSTFYPQLNPPQASPSPPSHQPASSQWHSEYPSQAMVPPQNLPQVAPIPPGVYAQQHHIPGRPYTQTNMVPYVQPGFVQPQPAQRSMNPYINHSSNFQMHRGYQPGPVAQRPAATIADVPNYGQSVLQREPVAAAPAQTHRPPLVPGALSPNGAAPTAPKMENHRIANVPDALIIRQPR